MAGGKLFQTFRTYSKMQNKAIIGAYTTTRHQTLKNEIDELTKKESTIGISTLNVTYNG